MHVSSVYDLITMSNWLKQLYLFMNCKQGYFHGTHDKLSWWINNDNFVSDYTYSNE